MDRLSKQQACQLLIEQEIEEGLKQGKSKYSIGKEVSAWIAKLFDAKINPHTIEVKAHRVEKLLTNVSTPPTIDNQKKIDTTNREEPEEYDWKEPEEYKKKEDIPNDVKEVKKRERFKMIPPSIGMQYARLAILDLENIDPEDLEYSQALFFVKKWIEDHERR